MFLLTLQKGFFMLVEKSMDFLFVLQLPPYEALVNKSTKEIWLERIIFSAKLLYLSHLFIIPVCEA